MSDAEWVAAGWTVLGVVIGCALIPPMVWLLNRTWWRRP
jgi:hypothetical protein